MSRLLVIILLLSSAILFTTDLQLISAHKVAHCFGSVQYVLLLFGSAPIVIKLLWLIVRDEMYVLAMLHQLSTLLIKTWIQWNKFLPPLDLINIVPLFPDS